MKTFAWSASLLPGEVNSFAVVSVADKLLWGGNKHSMDSQAVFIAMFSQFMDILAIVV